MTTRREFVRELAVLAGGSAALMWLASCKSHTYVQGTVAGNRIIVSKADFSENTFVVVKSEKYPAPIYLRRLNENQYTALLMECTHKQCEVRAYKNVLQCPCHGSEFSYTGEVLEPPATEPLKRFTVTTDDQNIIIE